MADENRDSKDAAKAADDATKNARKSRDEQLKAERKAADEATKEAQERVSKMRPTPTQEENDRAKLGIQSVDELDDKEPDGSEEDEEGRQKAISSPQNRSISTDSRKQ